MIRVGQNHIYIYIYTRCVYSNFWQGHHQIYGHMQYIYTVQANPKNGNIHIYIYIYIYMVQANPKNSTVSVKGMDCTTWF